MTYRTGCCRMRCRWAGRRTGTGMRRTTSGFITRRATGRRSGRSGGARGENLGKWSFSYHWDSDSGNYVGDFHATASNVYFAGKLISDGNQVCSGGNCTRAVFQDQVGTNRASGARFYPYGDEIGGFTATSNDREKFGTYVRDSMSGLDYAQERYYDSARGRFNTADTAVPDAKDPGSWNQYAYVGGDPINRLDPHGTCYVSPQMGFQWDDQDAEELAYNGALPDGTLSWSYGFCVTGSIDAGLDPCAQIDESNALLAASANCAAPIVVAAAPAQPQQPQPTCSISLYERPVGEPAGALGANHTYLDIQDSSGSETVEAGPDLVDAPFGYLIGKVSSP